MRDEITALLRNDLQDQQPYGAPQIDVPVRLNTNENSYPIPTDVAQDLGTALSREVAGLNRYPDRAAARLRSALASYVGRDTDAARVWAANGSNEILQQLLQVFGGQGKKAMGFPPSYSMHPVISRATGTEWCEGARGGGFDLDAESAAQQVQRERPDIVFLCSPNNPTGTALHGDVIASVYEHTDGIVVVDEAYAEFGRDGTASALDLLPTRPRLVVTRTLSKAFGLAGARVGYCIGDPRIVDAMQLVRLPYHLSTLTQTVALAALDHAPRLLENVVALKQQRDRMAVEIAELGLRVAPSDANFVFFGGLADSRDVWKSLVDRGVLIRDVGIEGWLRVSAGTPDETSAFLTALRDVCQKEKDG
ncbi:MAG TPA: histidinol-phosphate transaminase [Candidatus Stackebrandtia faecavium]|nr:histidinol-phosphate transaminase [Candidatus Stackebrandtia faecavium]